MQAYKIALVSIPIGFSHQLRLMWRYSTSPEPEGFNPYRVFSSAETRRRPRGPPDAWFQSLSGFLIS